MGQVRYSISAAVECAACSQFGGAVTWGVPLCAQRGVLCPGRVWLQSLRQAGLVAVLVAIRSQVVGVILQHVHQLSIHIVEGDSQV